MSKAVAEALVKFQQQLHNCFGRMEHQPLGLAYLSGLMSNMPAKSTEPVALEFLGEEDVRSLQRCMKTYPWEIIKRWNESINPCSRP